MSTKTSKEESLQKVDAKIISINSFILEKNTACTECLLCRNKLDNVCNACAMNNITDPSQCPTVKGKCEHIFHKHCIERWLQRSNHCPHPGCKCIWENA